MRRGAVNAAYRTLIGRTGFAGLPLPGVIPEVLGQELVEMCLRVYANDPHESV